eukprot:467410-Rhodomonas_salina.1
MGLGEPEAHAMEGVGEIGAEDVAKGGRPSAENCSLASFACSSSSSSSTEKCEDAGPAEARSSVSASASRGALLAEG